MSIDRTRELTQTANVSITSRIIVEMSIARTRALTHFCFHLLSNEVV